MMQHHDTVTGSCRSWAVIGGIILLTLTATGCNLQLFDAPTATAHRAVEVDFRAGAPIEIHSRNGYIRVIHDAAHDNVAAEADIRCGGATIEQAEERAANCQFVADYTDQGVLRIEPAFFDTLHPHDAANLIVRVPSGVDLTLRTSNGQIDVRQSQGSTIGTANAETSNGAIRISGTTGDVSLVTSNGPIHAIQVGGSLVARTTNAPITCSNVTGELRLGTTNGPITSELQQEQSGPIEATTSNASIVVQVGEGFQGRFEFRTSNETVVVRDPQKRIGEQELARGSGFVVLGDAASTSHLTSTNGKIVLQVE